MWRPEGFDIQNVVNCAIAEFKIRDFEERPNHISYYIGEKVADAILEALRNSPESYHPNSSSLSEKNLKALLIKINNHEHLSGRFVFIPDDKEE